MKTRNIVMNVMLLLIFVLAACGGNAPDTMNKPADPMMEQPTADAMMPHDTSMPDSVATPAVGTMMESPKWFDASMTNVQTNEAFTINDLKGKVVLVETMAIWCTNCKQQQGQVKKLHALLGERDDFVSLGLDIDPNENSDALKVYVDNNNFDWYYAVPSKDVSREIAALYGDQFLNPPSTPMLIVDRHGVAHPLPFGIKSADDLMKALQPFFDEST